MKKILLALAVVLIAVMAMVGCQRETRPAASSGGGAITVEIFDRGMDGGRSNAADNAWTKWIQEKVKADLNIDVTFIPVGRWSENVDIVNLMASGSAPDLCYTYNTEMISQFRQMGGILDLAPYIDQYLPDFRRLLGPDPALQGQDLVYRDRDPVTQSVYSVPSVVVNNPQRNMFIRKDWLDILGLQMPTTTQQFYEALIAFRDNADRLPGSGGNRVIPFGQDSDARWGLAQIVYAHFDIFSNRQDNRNFWIQNFSDRPITVDGYKEGLRIANRWFNEGLIYNDFPLMTVADDFFNLLKTGRVGAYSGNWDHPFRTDNNINGDLARNVPGAQFVPIDPIAVNGVTHKFVSDKPGLRIFIPSNSSNPVAALQYLNWLSKFENYNFIQIGHAGINHNMVGGVPQIIPASAGHEWIQNSANNIDITIPMNGIELGSPELNARVLALGYSGTAPELIVQAFSMSTANGRAPVVYQAITTLDGVYGQTLRDKADALIAQAVRAPIAQFDSVWDAGMRDYLQSGAQEIMDERARLWPR
ncbi:MAG: extracellular solute-binding protein [Treponema sp.]|nr:extracellular solute-binding protein [Treponema sp.]